MMLAASQGGGGELVYVWHATIAEAALDGQGSLTVNSGDASAYTATYTFAKSGNYRLFVIGKGGNGGSGGYGAFSEVAAGIFAKAAGGSGGSGAYGACAVYEVAATAGSTLTITYSATSTLVAINGHDITAAAGGNGGNGTNGTASIGGRTGGSAGSAGVAGSASGSNVSDGNISGVAGAAGTNGGTKQNDSNLPLAGPAGASTAAATISYMYGDGVAGGISTTGTDRDGNDGAYLRTGALSKLGNPGSGGGGGAAHETSANRVGGDGGAGQPGGLVIERRTYA